MKFLEVQLCWTSKLWNFVHNPTKDVDLTVMSSHCWRISTLFGEVFWTWAVCLDSGTVCIGQQIPDIFRKVRTKIADVPVPVAPYSFCDRRAPKECGGAVVGSSHESQWTLSPLLEKAVVDNYRCFLTRSLYFILNLLIISARGLIISWL